MLRTGNRMTRNAAVHQEALSTRLSVRMSTRRSVRYQRWLGLVLWIGLLWTLFHFGGR